MIERLHNANLRNAANILLFASTLLSRIKISRNTTESCHIWHKYVRNKTINQMPQKISRKIRETYMLHKLQNSELFKKYFFIYWIEASFYSDDLPFFIHNNFLRIIITSRPTSSVPLTSLSAISTQWLIYSNTKYSSGTLWLLGGLQSGRSWGILIAGKAKIWRNCLKISRDDREVRNEFKLQSVLSQTFADNID